MKALNYTRRKILLDAEKDMSNARAISERLLSCGSHLGSAEPGLLSEGDLRSFFKRLDPESGL